MIYGNAVMAPAALKTVILMDDNGNELTGVVTGEEVIFTATDNDVREGSVYASENGVSTGQKLIPSYNTSEGYRIIREGSQFEIVLEASDLYDYTKLQCIICPFNSSASQSVSAEKVVIEDNVYSVNSTTVISVVTKDMTGKSINLGITNNSSESYLIRYFTYKEII